MRTPLPIGIVGGMSPESTVTYYQRIIRKHYEEFGDHTYPRIVLASVSFQEYIDWQHSGDWETIARGLQREFDSLAAAGARIAGLATNTMHKVLPQIDCPIRILSIMEAISNHARERGISRVAVTGTKFTMSDGFYASGLSERGLKVSV
ncbi:MAG: aspartate/glutamate racemase family protein, partial [Candidatus Zixiibacteriota bacterium]